jgi:tetratricopeptide (TPR) repeat protein
MPRRRLLVLVAAALGVAGLVVAVALASSSGGGRREPAATGLQGVPPLVYALPQRLAPRGSPAARLARLERLGDPRRDPELALAVASAELAVAGAARGSAASQARERASAALAAAARHLGPSDARVAAGRALLAYAGGSRDDAERTLATLAQRRPHDALAAFEHGLVLLYLGRDDEADAVLRRARTLGADSSYGTLADNLLHPEMLPGYPPWVPSRRLTGPSAAPLRRAYALQGTRRADALASARTAVAVAPSSVEARVAVAVLAFDKDRPAAAFGRLGSLVAAHPRAVSPVFHLALLLAWIRDDARAQQEYEKAVRLDPRGTLGRVARAILVREGASPTPG